MLSALLSAAGLLSLAAWGASGKSDAERPPRCERCDVILIGLDDVRADRVGAAGAAVSRTPRIDAWAAGAFRFEGAVSAAPWTLPSFASIMTGLWPRAHGLTNKYDVLRSSADSLAPARLAEGVPTLARVLREAGYRTAAFTGGAALAPEYGLESGFEVYRGSAPFAGFDATLPAAARWLGAQTGGPRFLFAHGYDVHPRFPGGPRASEELKRLRRAAIEGAGLGLEPEEWTRHRADYDRAIEALDARVGAFLDEPRTARAVVLVVSDHGEELGDHGGIDHGPTLYEELIHVPMLLRVPGAPGRRVTGIARTVDILPTLLDIVGVAPPPGLSGVSLAAAMAGTAPGPDAAFAETDYLLMRSLRAIRTQDGWKAIYDRETDRAEVYDLGSDPGENRDLSLADPISTRDLLQRLWAVYPDL